MRTCGRHRVEFIGGEEDGDEAFCPICAGEEADAAYLRGEDTGDHSKAMFGVPARPETLRPFRPRPRTATKTALIALRLDDADDVELRKVAKRKGVGPSTFARMLLLEGLERERRARS